MLVIGEQPGGRPLCLPVAAQPIQQARRDNHLSILGSLSLFDTQELALAIDVTHSQRYQLTDTQSASIIEKKRTPLR